MDADKVALEIAQCVEDVSVSLKGPRFLFHEFINGIAAIIRRHQGEPKLCPSCRAADNNEYTDASGTRMRACFRCMIQWKVEPIPEASTPGKFPISRPCSACSGGDEEMKHHDHEALNQGKVNEMSETTKEEELRTALLLVLDNIDYMAGNCSMTDMVAAALPKEILDRARNAAKQTFEEK